MLNELDYQLLHVTKDASFNKIVSSLIIQASNGNTSMGPILDKIESDIPSPQRHKAYGAVAKAYYKAIKEDQTFIELTREICLRDLSLMVDNIIVEDNPICLDLLAVLTANYDPKKKAIDTLELIIDSGFAYERYMKLRKMIKNDTPRRN